MELLTTINLPSLLIPTVLGYILGILKERRHTKNEIVCLKKALKTELQTIQAIYYQLKISDEPPKGGDDIKVISLQSNYITVYEKNADKIGMLEPDTAKAVVIAYTHVAAFMDTLRVYGQRWEAMIAYERTGQKAYWEYYRKDIDRCFTFVRESQETTRSVITEAIDKLS